MENRDYLSEFREKYYNSDQRQFLNDTVTYLQENASQVLNDLRRKLESFLDALIQFQEKVPVPIGEIHLSLLLSSVYLEKPVFRIDAFGEGGVFGKHLCSSQIEVPWLFTEWECFRNNLAEHSKEMSAGRLIRQEQIRLLMFEVLNDINYLGFIYVKSLFFYPNEVKGLDKLDKCQPFNISVGQYYDWQTIVYREDEEVDIFFNLENKPLVFQRYQDKVFRDKVFDKLDLYHGYFKGCKFIRCSFQESSFNDAVFEECIFYDVTTSNVTMYGCSFLRCKIENMDFSGIDFWRNKDDKGNLYRPAEFIGCETNQQLPDMEVR